MRPLRPSETYRPEDRPPPGLPTVASVAIVATLALYSLAPLLALSGLFAAGVCWCALRECR